MVKCKIENCSKRAYFNFEDEKPLYCKEHSETNMVNIIEKICKEPDCKIIPCYNYPNLKKRYIL